MITRVRDTEDFHEGVSYAIEVLAGLLGVGINDFSHDAATETMEGDVASVIGNCLEVRFGDGSWPDIRGSGGQFRFLDDIDEFHTKFEQDYRGPVRHLPKKLAEFRVKFLREEVNEYEYALLRAQLAAEGDDKAEYTYQMEQALDALVDLAYVLFGSAHLQGFTPEIFGTAWDRVHGKNMEKELAGSAENSKRGYEKDVVKPQGWEPPKHSDLVEINFLTVPY